MNALIGICWLGALVALIVSIIETKNWTGLWLLLVVVVLPLSLDKTENK